MKIVANATKRSLQAVKAWRASETSKSHRLPDSVSLINLAREFDDVWQGVCELVGRAPVIEHENPQSAHAVAMLHQIALGQGPQAEWARGILWKAGTSE